MRAAPRARACSEAHINAGFPVNVQSPSHAVRTHEDSAGIMVTLTEKVVPADSDFVLEWRPRVGDAPGAALFRDVFDGQTYALLMVMPPENQRRKHNACPGKQSTSSTPQAA